MERNETPTPLETLLHNADKAGKLEETVKTRARKLSLDDAKEIRDKLRETLAQAQESVNEDWARSGEAHHQVQKAVETIRNACEAAERCYERKHQWASEVDPKAKVIRECTTRAKEIHERLRRDKRRLEAADVLEMKNRLADIDAEAMSAWAALRELDIPESLERRLSRYTNTIANALKACERAYQIKIEWEQAVGVNVSAVEAELNRLEAIVVRAEEAPPRDPSREPAGEDRVAAQEAAEKEAAEKGDAEKEAAPPPRNETPPSSVSNHRPESAEGKKGSGRPDPVPLNPASRTGTPNDSVDPIALAHKIENMLRTRRPIDRPQRERLNARLATLAERGGFLDKLTHRGAGPQGKETADDTPADILAALERVEAALGLTPLTARTTPKAPQEAGDDPAALPTAPPEGTTPRPAQDDKEDEHPSMATEQDIKSLQEALHRVRRLLESARLPRAERARLWSRFRRANTTLRNRRDALAAAAKEHFAAMVQEAHRLATNDSPSHARRWIQSTQKALAESLLTRREREPFFASLREAWAAAAKHQQALRERHEWQRKEALDRLGGHFMRWQRRKEGILRILERLGRQIETYRERQQTSTSIGYRVVAEQRMADLKARVAELEAVLEALEAKIADVAPRLEAAGWRPPEDPAPGDDAGHPADNAGVSPSSRPVPSNEPREGGEEGT